MSLGKLFHSLRPTAGNEALYANVDLCRMGGCMSDVNECSCWVFGLLGSKSMIYFGA